MATQVGRTEPQNYAALIGDLGHIADELADLDRHRGVLVAKRDRLIVRLADAFSEREIAKVAQLTGPRVHQIKETARAERWADALTEVLRG